jgi:nitroreductase
MANSANALQNIQLAASALRLGACWISQLHWLTDLPELRNYFKNLGLRSDEDIFGSVAIGYPDVVPVAKLPVRKDGRVATDRCDFTWIPATEC